MPTIKVSQHNIGPSRKVEWFCRCEGYTILASKFGQEYDGKTMVSELFRNKVVVETYGGDIIETECERCGKEWVIIVYQRAVPVSRQIK